MSLIIARIWFLGPVGAGEAVHASILDKDIRRNDPEREPIYIN